MRRPVLLCAIMKREAPYIIEWVAYHRLLGFDLMIADNGGGDGTSELLVRLEEAGHIERLDLTWARGAPQIAAYRAMLRSARALGYDFVGFIDCDEFFSRRLPIEEPTPSVGEGYITQRFLDTDASQLSFHWMCFGGQTDDATVSAPVLKRFSHHASPDEWWNVNIKSFVRVAEMFEWRNSIYLGPMLFAAHFFPSANRHWLIDNQQAWVFDSARSISHHTGMILHHQIKSPHEYAVKASRGTAGSRQKHKYSAEFYAKHDYRDLETPASPAVVAALTAKMNELCNTLGPTTRFRRRLSDEIRMRFASFGLSKVGGHTRRPFTWLNRSSLPW